MTLHKTVVDVNDFGLISGSTMNFGLEDAMGYRVDTLSAVEWEGLTDEQRRMLKIAYLMGVKDALEIGEGHLGADVVNGAFTEDQIGAMDHRLGFMSGKASDNSYVCDTIHATSIAADVL